MTWTRARERAAVLALLVVQAAQLAYAIRTDGMAFDELAYVASGYRHLAAGDHRFGAEHPPLARLLAALPLLALSPRLRALGPRDAAGGAWYWAHDFVHVDNRHLPLLPYTRAPIAALTLALSLLVWHWARTVAGPPAGLVALAFAVFHPSLLAHGHLATTDAAGALTMVLASFALWRWCESPGPWRALGLAAALGAAFATRLTGALLLPAFAVILALWWRTRPEPRSTRARHVTLLAALTAVAVPTIVWAAYGFRYAPWPGEPMPRIVPPGWAEVLDGHFAARVLGALKAAHVLPAAYLASLEVYLMKSMMGHQGYLLGQMSTSGWPHYFLVALLVKSTPGFLAALLVLAVFGRRALRGMPAAKHWLVPAATLLLAASLGRVQVGERYILPVYPYLILLVGACVPALVREKGGRAVLAALLVLHAAPSLAAMRHGYLSYFNALVGGRENGHLVLSDSNLDWGQDLPRLAAWMKRNGVSRVQLAYWGTDDPSRYGIVRDDLPGHTLYPVSPPAEPFTGTVVVSPTLLTGLYPPPAMPDVYPRLLRRRPDDRAGIFFVYRLPPEKPRDPE